MSKKTEEYTKLPLLPLRDIAVFPQMVVPLFVGRDESIQSLESSLKKGKMIFLVAQEDAEVTYPTRKDLYGVGVVAEILQLLHLQDGTIKVLVEGVYRARLAKCTRRNGHVTAVIEPFVETGNDSNMSGKAKKELIQSVIATFEHLVRLRKKMATELLSLITSSAKDPGLLADYIASHLMLSLSIQQDILETVSPYARLTLIKEILDKELYSVKLDETLQKRVEEEMVKGQRHYYLNKKLDVIKQELSELGEDGVFDEEQQLLAKINASGMPPAVKEKALSEFNKLKAIPPMSAEANVGRNYLDWLLQVPWNKYSELNHDLKLAEKILDADHYGLRDVKQCILEHLAVGQRVKQSKGPILCLVGPPGVGKTSLGQSIAHAMGREFIRVSLGGVRDEAEIRGHRRTYVGALPGKIIQKIAKTKVCNPLFMLDEVDKMGMDYRGDPASALLEVLDPEQNNTFNDHYLEVDYDLSDVMFIATANSLNIPPALLDRMEIIRIAGYTEEEKLSIANKYLIPRQMKQTGLAKGEIKILDAAIFDMVRYYTREAGVRSLERELSKLCRKVVKQILTKSKKKKSDTMAMATKKRIINYTIHAKNLEKYLGVKRYRFGLAEQSDQVGQVTGLAWTEAGGELLTIEAQAIPGKGKSLQTGRLGDVMQESIYAATTFVRSRSSMMGLSAGYFQSHDFHIHVPEGATPKDGPSAGIGMCTALVSAISQVPVRADVAMTGEITLRGEVLPIGGLKEKLLAALRANIKHVIIPEENKRDLKEIPKLVRDSLEIHPVKWVDQVFDLALQRNPVGLATQSILPPLKTDIQDHISPK